MKPAEDRVQFADPGYRHGGLYRVDQPDMTARGDDDEPAPLDDVAGCVLVRMLVGMRRPSRSASVKWSRDEFLSASRSTSVFSSTRSKDSRGMWPVVKGPRSACGVSQHTVAMAAASSAVRSSIPQDTGSAPRGFIHFSRKLASPPAKSFKSGRILARLWRTKPSSPP